MAVATMKGIWGHVRFRGSSREDGSGLAANPRPWHASPPVAPPRGTREGERHEPEQTGTRGTDPRMGADRAAVRLARAATLRGDTPSGALRRAGLRAVRGGRPLAEHPLQEAERLRVGRDGKPLRLRLRTPQEAAPRHEAPHRRPEGRAPRLQPQRDSKHSPRLLREEARRALGGARARRGTAAAKDPQELPAVPRGGGADAGTGVDRGAAPRRLEREGHSLLPRGTQGHGPQDDQEVEGVGTRRPRG